MEHYFTNNSNLKSELRKISFSIFSIEEKSFTFYSDNGVFSKDKIDYGSRALLNAFLSFHPIENTTLLDVGCGYGFMGIVLAKLKKLKVTLIDINKRAVHLSQINAKENDVEVTVIESNIYEQVKEKYRYIITNPPIRAGKAVVYEILDKAKEHLEEDGQLWFVMRKDHGVKSAIKHLSETYNCQIIKKDKGFYVIMANLR